MSCQARRSGSGCPICSPRSRHPGSLNGSLQTAERAREEQWPYEQFLETLCEAEVFAREASGARTAHPVSRLPGAQDAGGLRLHRPALRRTAAGDAPRAAGLGRGARQRLPDRPARAPARVISRSRWGSRPASTATASRSRPPNSGSAASRKPKSATPLTKSSDAWSATSC